MRRRMFFDDGSCAFCDGNTISDDFGTVVEGDSLALQSAKDECDINVIVKRFGLTGVLPQGFRMPVYGDFVDVPDTYQGALEIVRTADEAFMRVPPQIRARFNNDPGEFMDFCSDPSNIEELKKMGLAIDKPAESATIVPKPEGSPPA